MKRGRRDLGRTKNLSAAGDSERKGSYHTAWSVPPSPPSHLLRVFSSGAGRCFQDSGGLSHPL